MSKQAAKYHLSLAGEFYVAAELQRRGIAAAVTYGNAKRADVVAFTDAGYAVAIEVKSTSDVRWVVGGVVPEPTAKPWVFVYVPKTPDEAPSFHFMTQSQLRDVVLPDDLSYRDRYLAKHGEEYGDRVGVVNLSRKQAEPYRNAWHTITALLDPESTANMLTGSPNPSLQRTLPARSRGQRR